MRKIKMKTPHGYFLSQVRAGEKRKKNGSYREKEKYADTHTPKRRNRKTEKE